MDQSIDPDEHVFAIYRVESSLPLVESGVRIAVEESVGTWTEITTTNRRVQETLAAKVVSTDEEHKFVRVAYPLQLFDMDSGVANILSIVAGNLFGLSEIDRVRLMDIELPYKVLDQFPGPKFGMEGIREIIGTQSSRRPHLGTIVKPKVGLNPEETASVVYEAALGGVDFVKDDETLVDQDFCPLEKRVVSVMNALDKAKSETGSTVLYAANISADGPKLMELADEAMENGANMLMLDMLTVGIGAIDALASDPSVKVPIHVHRTMHGAMTRDPTHGIHMIVLAKLCRMVGGDQLHTGAAAGKMEAEIADLLLINDFLRSSWGQYKRVFPVASGGIHPARVGPNLSKLGLDIVINAGGGIHGHPRGTRAGALAMRQAIDAFIAGVDIRQYSEVHPELREALELWRALR